MTCSDIDELTKACRTYEPKPDDESVPGVGSIWFHGDPAFAPEGSVALALDDGATVVILAKDVVKVERDDDGRFGVALPIDTPVLMVRTSVRRAFEVVPNKGAGCGCSGPASPDTLAARRLGGSFGSGISHCNALEAFCAGNSGGLNLFSGDVSIDSLQNHLIRGAKCRDVWFGCIAGVFDSTFGP